MGGYQKEAVRSMAVGQAEQVLERKKAAAAYGLLGLALGRVPWPDRWPGRRFAALGVQGRRHWRCDRSGGRGRYVLGRRSFVLPVSRLPSRVG